MSQGFPQTRGNKRLNAKAPFAQVIYVEDSFNADEAEGVRLTDELVVGKQMAGGSQVG